MRNPCEYKRRDRQRLSEATPEICLVQQHRHPNSHTPLLHGLQGQEFHELDCSQRRFLQSVYEGKSVAHRLPLLRPRRRIRDRRVRYSPNRIEQVAQRD